MECEKGKIDAVRVKKTYKIACRHYLDFCLSCSLLKRLSHEVCRVLLACADRPNPN
jgi:hypothetical protein